MLTYRFECHINHLADDEKQVDFEIVGSYKTE